MKITLYLLGASLLGLGGGLTGLRLGVPSAHDCYAYSESYYNCLSCSDCEVPGGSDGYEGCDTVCGDIDPAMCMGDPFSSYCYSD